MAFGFLGDVIENIGEAILPRGTRGATFGALAGRPFGKEMEGAAFGSQLSSDIASGRKGQEAVDTPTLKQTPGFAPESALSSVTNINVGRIPTFADYEGRVPLEARVGGTTMRDIGAGVGVGEVMDIIPDISISKFFGDPCMKKMPKLVGMTKDGCPTVTRKQQRVLRQMAMYMPLESVAYEAGVDTTTMARLISKSFPPRARGITGAQLRTANRVNNKILSMAGKLGYNVTPKTKAQLGCK